MICEMWKRLLAGTLLCIVAAGSAKADVTLGFEGLENETLIDAYGGFNWDNMYSIVVSEQPASGYTNGLVGGANVATNGFGLDASITFGPGGTTAFNFHSAYLTAAWNDGLTVIVNGYYDTDLLYSTTVMVDTTGPTLFQFDYYGITQLTFSSSGGTPAGFSGGSGTNFVIDEMMLSIPEPTSLSMALMGGMAGLTGAWRRRDNARPA